MHTCRWMSKHVQPVRAKSVMWISWDSRENPPIGGATWSLGFSLQDLLFLHGGRFFESSSFLNSYLAIIDRTMSPAFSAWSAMEPMVSASLII